MVQELYLNFFNLMEKNGSLFWVSPWTVQEIHDDNYKNDYSWEKLRKKSIQV